MAKIKTTDMSINPDTALKSNVTSNDGVKASKASTRKVLAKNCISHRTGHGKRGNIHLQTSHGALVRLPWKQADAMVSEGSAKYISRTKFNTLSAKKK
jgi:hypothetical protein